MNIRRTTVRTLDTGGGALLGVAVLDTLLLGWPWLVAVVIAVVALASWVLADALTRRGWRAAQ